MRTRIQSSRGFTLIEMVVTVGIIVILAGLAAVGMQLYKPRAGLANTAAELTALLNSARQNALSTGQTTWVMIFPQYTNPLGGTGRVVLYADTAPFSFSSSTATPNFGSYDPSTAPTTPTDVILETLDLPLQASFGSGGVAIPALAAPYNLVPIPSVSGCSFCASTGDGRGAVVFDSRGRAQFYNGSSAPPLVAGGTLALQGSNVSGYRLFVITSTTGSVKAFNRG